MWRLGTLVIARLVVASLLLWTGRATTVLCFDFMSAKHVAAVRHLNSDQNQQENIQRLELGKSIERQLKGGETHSYTISLSTGQYLQVLVDQRGIDVDVSLLAPDGKKLGEMDSPNSTQGPELISVIAEQSGGYRIEVISSRKTVPPGRYEVRIVTIRDANESDRKRIEAQKAYFEGGQLQRKGTAESRQQAIKKFEESAQNWRATGEGIMELHALSLNAQLHRQLGQLQNALDLYNRALDLARHVNERREEAFTLGGVALVYSDMGYPRKSREYFEQVLSLWKEIGDQFLVANTNINVGLVTP